LLISSSFDPLLSKFFKSFPSDLGQIVSVCSLPPSFDTSDSFLISGIFSLSTFFENMITIGLSSFSSYGQNWLKPIWVYVISVKIFLPFFSSS
jgi:hypothetical protein